jgi:diguanylate cyclase
MLAKDLHIMGGMMTSAQASAPLHLASARLAGEAIAAYDQSRDGTVTGILVGIRDLKQINERLGRATGDLIIRRVAQRLIDFLRESLAFVPLVAKLPGREFLIVLGGERSTSELESVARRLISILSTDLGEGDDALHISPRIGIAVAGDGERGPDMLQRAHEALSAAYNRKGRKFAFAGAPEQGAAEQAKLLDNGLRDAIAGGQIAIFLQPQFDVASGILSGAEALARWQHPQLGEIDAARLFASADRCDLREELSGLIQREAVSIAASWTGGLSDLRLSVNLGAEELGEGYAARLCDMLARTDFPPERLTVELTEESLVRDIELAAAELQQLRERGIRIAVDDFGTGYSSLAYLAGLPLDYLKIDKRMTQGITRDSKDRIVIRAVIAMGKALELKIIAEGVERKEELDLLRAEGCDYFQGFLRSEPLDPAAFERFALLNG